MFWDLGGQIRMRSIWDKYYAEANAMIFVIDSADSDRLEEARTAFGTLLMHCILLHSSYVYYNIHFHSQLYLKLRICKDS